MNRIQVRYFASIREALGTGSERIETSAATVAALRAQLIERSPAHAQALAHGKAVRSSLDQRMVERHNAIDKRLRVVEQKAAVAGAVCAIAAKSIVPSSLSS